MSSIIRLRRQIWKLTTLLRLAMIVLKVSGFSFARVRLADGSDNNFRVHRFELDASVVNFHLPVDAARIVVSGNLDELIDV